MGIKLYLDAHYLGRTDRSESGGIAFVPGPDITVHGSPYFLDEANDLVLTLSLPPVVPPVESSVEPTAVPPAAITAAINDLRDFATREMNTLKQQFETPRAPDSYEHAFDVFRTELKKLRAIKQLISEMNRRLGTIEAQQRRWPT